MISDSDSKHDDSASDIDLTWLKDKNKTDFQRIGKLNSIIKELKQNICYFTTYNN